VADTTDIFGLTGATLEGKYSIERVVAAGGFGVVYRAKHNALNRPVAIKVLKLSDQLGEVGRREIARLFEREAQTIASLDHPAVVKVIDFGATPMPDGVVSPWMVLEWLDGVTLAAHREQLGRALSPVEALTLLRPAFEALGLAHSRGIAHRDIKPANLMCVPDWRGALTLRVLDFGIARVMEPDATAGSGETHTQATIAPYSPMYGAPEQVARARTGPWTDVHALALVLVELLTARPPYDGDDLTAWCAATLSPQRPTPRALGRRCRRVGAGARRGPRDPSRGALPRRGSLPRGARRLARRGAPRPAPRSHRRRPAARRAPPAAPARAPLEAVDGRPVRDRAGRVRGGYAVPRPAVPARGRGARAARRDNPADRHADTGSRAERRSADAPRRAGEPAHTRGESIRPPRSQCANETRTPRSAARPDPRSGRCAYRRRLRRDADACPCPLRGRSLPRDPRVICR